MKIMTVHAWPTKRPGNVPFSSRHKARFQELREIGELYAINGHDERLNAGPWRVTSEITDSDTVNRLKTRFRAAVRGAAIRARAPYRVDLVDWWISRLARGKRLRYLEGLIDRSIEFCEELETRSIELGTCPTKTEVVAGGLYRDRYRCDRRDSYFLYDGLPRSFSDGYEEFNYWTQHIWSGFMGLIAGVESRSLRRQPDETRNAYRARVKHKADRFYHEMKGVIRQLSFDLAVLQAAYVIDRGLRGNAANRAFKDESASLVDSVETFWCESSKRLGLSYIKQKRKGVDLVEPFREVGEDLLHLISAMPMEEGAGSLAAPVTAASVPTDHPDPQAFSPLARSPANEGNLRSIVANVSPEAASSAPSVENCDFVSKAQRIDAIDAYAKSWQCSEAALARTARVNPADLSKWKKDLLPAESGKKARIEKALKNNEAPTLSVQRRKS